MPQVHYPFIDVAVHPAVRARFAAGDAVVLFSRDMKDVLWANGAGARQFGHDDIYDLIESGPEAGSVAFRQLAAAAAQLAMVGDRRGFMMRTTSGFRSTAAQAEVNLIAVGQDEAVMFSAPSGSAQDRLASLLSGFDDPDTHMAVLGSEGEVLVASDGFAHIGVMQDTARALIAAASRSTDGLVKRPIPSGSGYLPAAIGRLADDLYLLFCVETSIGRMDAPEEREVSVAPVVTAPLAEATMDETESVEAVASADIDWTPGAADDAAAVVGQDDEDAIESVEEGASEQDIEHLALIDGASAADVETASTEAGEDFDLSGDAPTELDADKAEAMAQGEPAPLESDAVSSELAGDIAETSEPEMNTPEAYAETAAHEGVADEQAGEGESDTDAVQAFAGEHADEPTDEIVSPATTEASELVSDMAEAAGDAETTALPDVASAELAGDMAAASDYDDATPEEFQDEERADTAGADAVWAGTADAGATSMEADASETQPDDTNPASGAVDDELQDDAVLSDAETVATAEDASQDAQASDPTAADTADTETPVFAFNPGARPVRFVWKLDADGAFAEVSGEFAATVGPHAGDIVGQRFRELAVLFDLDPDQEIAALLDRRDTWSGRTIRWPVEGSELVVPVDLAALPTYSRNREFDGFRGFGIIRVGDAEHDPNGHGLKFVEADMADEAPDDAAAVVEAPVSAEPVDEFRGEVPALDIVSNPLATFSDKIVKLEERRAKATRDGLSANEQAALKEIARQLEPFGKRPNEDVEELDDAQSKHEEDSADARAPDSDMQDGIVPSVAESQTEETASEPVQDRSELDDDEAQSLFEDLGAGPGLTSYAIDQVPMAILIHAGDRLIEANDEFRRLTGYGSIAALDRAGGLDALITRREGADAGVYLVRADGTQVLVSARLQSVRYEGSSALMLALTPAAGTLAAVTTDPQVIVESEPARKLAALAVEVDELRSILETATDGVIVLDTEGRIRSLNRSASALFNFDDGEIRGKPFAMLFAHESQKSVQDYLAGLAGHGVASVLNDGREVIGREASGGFIPLFMTMGRMPGSNSYCAVIRDITQWKRSEEELRAAKRAAETANQHKSDFLARVSHEIRTPLNAIIGFSDMIASEHFGPSGHTRYVEYAADIGRSGRHVLDIVNDLLDISKIEAGEMDLDFAAVGINDCVSEAVSLVQPQANAQRVIIRTSLSQAVPDVVADLRSIKQIALNILANAIRYTPSGGQIVVSTAYETSGAVTLRIRDTGVGMSKAELEQAMKPFGQVAPGTRQRGDGTGLGLPLTKAMTEANRASFTIHSAPNEGTLVEISFPPQRVLAD